MNRYFTVLAAAGVAGIAAAVAMPVVQYARMGQAERQAAQALVAVRDAQAAFRRSSGGGGYASDLTSLTTSCPGDAHAPLVVSPSGGATRYALRIRAARGAASVARDCHGRATVTDFYAAATPRGPLDGRQALALTSHGRIYVFFDGIAPRENDMGVLGLAVALEALDSFKIP